MVLRGIVTRKRSGGRCASGGLPRRMAGASEDL